MLSSSPFRFAGSGETSTTSDLKRKRQPEKPEISLSWIRRHIRTLPEGVKNLCIPRAALAEDILELSRTAAPTDATTLKIQDSKFNLLTRHSQDKYGENDRFLQQSLIQANHPTFERLLKAIDKPNFTPLIEIAALKDDRPAFEKILEKATRTKSEVPEATLRFVADCGQVDFLRKLFATSVLPADRKKALWKTAIEQRSLIDGIREANQAEQQQMFNNILPDEESEFEMTAEERGNATQMLMRSGLTLEPDAQVQALRKGIKHNCTDLVKCLLYMNGDLAPTDKQAFLEQAMTDQASPEILRLLIGAGADVNARDNWNLTPLHKAAYLGQSTFGKILIEAGANVNTKDIWGRTSLHQAACADEPEFSDLLIQKGAHVNVKDNDGNTPLHGVANLLNSRPAFGTLLIKAGADVNAPNNSGCTPLHQAVHQNEPDFGKMLIEAGANVNARDKWDRTALHEAAYNGKFTFGKMLLQKNADMNAKDKDGKTPLDVAMEKGHIQFADMLRMATAKRSA